VIKLTVIIIEAYHRCQLHTKFYLAFTYFKKAYDSVRSEVLYSILIEFGIPRKLAELIKMCLNETYSTVPIGKNLSDKFPIQNDLK
jgi:negative regulator of genetic competence, sporulation and motility